MQAWADPDHMRPAVNPAYCHVGAGVAQAADGRILLHFAGCIHLRHQPAVNTNPVPGDDSGSGVIPDPPVSQIIIPVKIASPDADGRIYHIVRAGQSFWSIAIAYQITIHDLEVWNNLSRDNDLVVGQKLFIPSSGTEGYATPTPVGMVVLATPDAEGKIVHEVAAVPGIDHDRGSLHRKSGHDLDPEWAASRLAAANRARNCWLIPEM